MHFSLFRARVVSLSPFLSFCFASSRFVRFIFILVDVEWERARIAIKFLAFSSYNYYMLLRSETYFVWRWVGGWLGECIVFRVLLNFLRNQKVFLSSIAGLNTFNKAHTCGKSAPLRSPRIAYNTYACTHIRSKSDDIC